MIAQNSIVQNKWAVSPYCKLLLHMNGANDGTTFIDASPSPKTITVNGNTCTKTAVKRFGTASAYIGGTGDYLTIADSTDWDLSSNMSIATWFYPTSTNDNQVLIGQFQDNNNLWFLALSATSNVIKFNVLQGGSFTISLAPSITVTQNKWNHIALIANNGVCQLYLNGVTVGTTATSVTTSFNAPLAINGTYQTSTTYKFTGYIDEVIFWNGAAISISDIYLKRSQCYDYAISEWSGQ